MSYATADLPSKALNTFPEVSLIPDLKRIPRSTGASFSFNQPVGWGQGRVGWMWLRSQKPAETQTIKRRGISCTQEFVARDSHPPPREPSDSAIPKAYLSTTIHPLSF